MEDHNKIIKNIVKTELKDLNLFQKSSSRLWFYDNKWYLISIEFQPSGYNKGTYLNCGISWLWDKNEYISFDIGYRIKEFNEFINIEDFSNLIKNFTKIIRNEVNKYLKDFKSLKDVIKYYKQNSINIWNYYHGYIAARLLDDNSNSNNFFNKIILERVKRKRNLNKLKNIDFINWGNSR